VPSYFFLVIYENSVASSSLKLAGILRFVRFAPLPTKEVAVTTPTTLIPEELMVTAVPTIADVVTFRVPVVIAVLTIFAVFAIPVRFAPDP
jgi:hypothetical protein